MRPNRKQLIINIHIGDVPRGRETILQRMVKIFGFVAKTVSWSDLSNLDARSFQLPFKDLLRTTEGTSVPCTIGDDTQEENCVSIAL